LKGHIAAMFGVAEFGSGECYKSNTAMNHLEEGASMFVQNVQEIYLNTRSQN
jgi:predicted glycosyl hydrolase (DUF1957 family)